jgi:uncharacterized protein with HEPN domain
MPRDSSVYLEDMLTALGRIRSYTQHMDEATFRADLRTLDAVLRNLEVIGEAAKRLPADLQARAPEVEWRKITGMRDFIAHAYFEVDLAIVWDVVAHKLEPLERSVRRLRGG